MGNDPRATGGDVGETYATSLRDVNYSEIFEASGAHAQVVTEAVNIKDALNTLLKKSTYTIFIDVKTLSTISPITQGLVEMRVRTAIE